MPLRLRVTEGNKAIAEIDDGSGWRLVPEPWEFTADRRGPNLDLYLQVKRERASGIRRARWPEPKLPEPVLTLTCAALGYFEVWIDSVEYVPASAELPKQNA